MSAYMQMIVNWLIAKTRQFAHDEAGGGEIIATVVVIAVVIMLGVAFSSQIGEFFTTLWEQATGTSGSIGKDL